MPAVHCILTSPKSQCPRLLLYQMSSHPTQIRNHPTNLPQKEKVPQKRVSAEEEAGMEGQWRVATTKTMYDTVLYILQDITSEATKISTYLQLQRP